MRNIIFLILIGIMCLTNVNSLAQAPEKFNYQAVIRDNAGELITKQSVGIKLSILDETSSGTVLYSEEHAVSTNAYGQLVIKVGDGTVDVGIFSGIDWSSGDKYLKVEIDQTGGDTYTSLGEVQLLSVPYALYAKNVENKDDADADSTNEIQDLNLTDDVLTVTNHPSPTEINLSAYQGTNTDEQELSLTGTDLSITGGNTVDLVSIQDGVDDADNSTTNELQNLILDGDTLEISNGNQVVFPYDSSRWVVNGDKLYYNTGNVGIGSSDPASKLEVKSSVTSGALFQVINANNDTVFAVYPDGVKVFVDSEAKGKVGGFAVSGRSPSKGIANYFNVSGDNTPIIINPSEPRVVWFPRKEAFWAGRVLIEHPDSVGFNSLAIGYEAVAKGNNSQSLGYQTRARGNFSTAIGYKTQANGVGCFAVGGEERGVDGVGTGVNTIADGIASFALGLGANASGIANTAIGLRSSATGNFASTAFGVFASATANRATAIGFGSVASAEQSMAIGVSDTASAYNSMAMGVGSRASGIAAIALGTFVEANTTGTFVVGQLNDPFGTTDLWNTSDPIFVVGNGIFGIPGVLSTAIKSNAFTILKNGNMGVGIDTPQRTVHIKDVMRLEPRLTAPLNPSEGDIYFNGVDKKLMVYDGTTWQACW